MEMLDQLAKNWHKTTYYAQGVMRNLLPARYWQGQLIRALARFEQMPAAERERLLQRVNYCNKLTAPFVLPPGLNFDRQLYPGKKSTAYAMDFKWWLSFFAAPASAPTPGQPLGYSYLFGDITHVPETPTFLKSRPIATDASNQSSVLLKLNQIRHYYRVQDTLPFVQKLPQLVWRGKSNHPDRRDVLARYFDSALCNVGDTHYAHKRTAYERPFMSIPEQLRYRYVLSIEGNDVATNLKWIMASQSLCLMRKPRYETWFMEGSLLPGVHYVQLRDDHSDLEDQVEYYNAHPQAAQQIVRNANNYVAQFFDQPRELLLTLLVMQKYFQLSGQLPA